MHRFSTSSVTNVPGQTSSSSLSLGRVSSACRARHTNTSITLGSIRVVAPLRVIVFRLGSTSQEPTWKPLSKSRIIYQLVPPAPTRDES